MTTHKRLIKVCGMRHEANIRAVEALGIDMMGFIFWPGSSRCVSSPPAYLPERCRRVGVFVDEDADRVRRIADACALDCVQLHGRETPDYCARLSAYTVIKAFSIATAADLPQTDAYADVASYFLFDTKGRSAGGNGTKFDWEVLQAYTGSTPFLLSGGIGPDDAAAVSAFSHPRCVGIDINSRFELRPGLKDTAAIAAFIDRLAHATR